MVVIMIEYLEYFPLIEIKRGGRGFSLFTPSPWADGLSREQESELIILMT